MLPRTFLLVCLPSLPVEGGRVFLIPPGGLPPAACAEHVVCHSNDLELISWFPPLPLACWFSYLPTDSVVLVEKKAPGS